MFVCRQTRWIGSGRLGKVGLVWVRCGVAWWAWPGLVGQDGSCVKGQKSPNFCPTMDR
jgi:hypothetical protein